jgi:hypothetical protein
MGTVIPVDFKRRRRAHAYAEQPPVPGMPGQTVALAACVTCLACLHAPLLVLWRAWLPSVRSQPPRPGTGAEEM